MSYDLYTRTAACDHLQLNERYILDTRDLRTLVQAADPFTRMRAPINGVSLLQLYLGGVPVPPGHPVYGFSFQRDETRLDEADRFLKIVFNREVRVIKPLIEVSYITTQAYCLKCSATGVTNDLKVDNTGGILHLTGRDKLIHRSMKWILSSRCAFYPAFVCRIKEYIGQKFGLAITEADISQEIVNALQKMKAVQQAQATIQSLDSAEVLNDVGGISALLDPANPTKVRVSVTILANKDNSPLPLNFTLRAGN